MRKGLVLLMAGALVAALLSGCAYYSSYPYGDYYYPDGYYSYGYPYGSLYYGHPYGYFYYGYPYRSYRYGSRHLFYYGPWRNGGGERRHEGRDGRSGGHERPRGPGGERRR